MEHSLQHTMAGSISQSSHQYGRRVSRRAINRRLIAITASVNVAILTPSIRGTWVACRSTPGGGGGSDIVAQWSFPTKLRRGYVLMVQYWLGTQQRWRGLLCLIKIEILNEVSMDAPPRTVFHTSNAAWG